MKMKLLSIFRRTKEQESELPQEEAAPSPDFLAGFQAGVEHGYPLGYNDGKSAGIEETKRAAIKSIKQKTENNHGTISKL